MGKRKKNFNDIYISERLQENLRPISNYALTAVVAPMGYGKTTAINWYLDERARQAASGTATGRGRGREGLKGTKKPQIIRVSVYSDNLAIFWKSIQSGFCRGGLDFLKDYPCPTDAAGGSMLADDLCRELEGDRACYIFIDDFHLLTDARAARFLCVLANRLPGNVHLLVASRDKFLQAEEIVRLGGRIYQLGTDELRLNHTELAVYANRCGTTLDDNQVETLLYSSEGWFSAVYLNLKTLSERGALPDANSDIYTMFTAAMIDPLTPTQMEFVAVMGLADEFTVEMADFVLQTSDGEKILATLTGQNAFIKCLDDGVTFRFHHMMKECAVRTFKKLPHEKQATYRERFGKWYEGKNAYLHSMDAYFSCGDFDGLLRVVQKDAGILLSSLKPETVLEAMEECPISTLKKHPLAILVLMRSMFNWRKIPKMMELKALLLAAAEDNPKLSPEERGNLLGECDLIMSFLCYNDISAMSRLHRSASRQMTRPAISIHKSGGWTFGSPSVLMMFHREPGALEKELEEMEECMPHYYRITDGHGQGAEKIMNAEAYFMQGRFEDAQIELESAYAQIEGNGQENMLLCCDFLASRLAHFADIKQRRGKAERYGQLIKHHNTAWINIWNAACAYEYALTGEKEKIPEIYRNHNLAAINILAPGKPMLEMIENQVYLAQGEFPKVIGRSAGLLAVCEGMHYGLVALHVQIQTAAAYEMLGKRPEARKLLAQALDMAKPDGFILPFAENYGYLKELLTSFAIEDEEFVHSILQLGEAYEKRQKHVAKQATLPPAFASLTERETEIVALMAKRLSNREIAEKLFLSEGSVRQYINRIYGKLQIEGSPRSKRTRLAELLAGGPLRL